VSTHWYVISGLGATRETDALFAAMAVPQVLLTIFSGSLSNVLLPLLATVEGDQVRRETWGFAVTAAGGFAALAAVLYPTAPLWVRWLVPGFSAPDLALTASLAQIQLLSLALMAGAAVFTAYTQSTNRFILAEGAGLIGGVASLATVVALLPRFGVEAAAWAYVLRGAVHLACLLPIIGWVRPAGWKSRVQQEGRRRTGPLLVGASYYKLDPLVDRILASMSMAGGLSLLSVAQQVYSAGAQVIAKATVSPVVPRLATVAAAGRWAEFRAIYRRRLTLVGAIVVAAALGTVLAVGGASRQLASLGGLGPDEVTLLWLLLTVLVGLLLGGALGQITATAFYAIGDTRTPTRLGVYVFTAHVPVKVVAFLTFGLVGLAGAISAYYLVALIVQLVALERTVGRALDRGHEANTHTSPIGITPL
jgi:putative peptidoglycan lipid II flippase